MHFWPVPTGLFVSATVCICMFVCVCVCAVVTAPVILWHWHNKKLPKQQENYYLSASDVAEVEAASPELYISIYAYVCSM